MRMLGALAFIVLLCCFHVPARAQGPPERPPNVILVLVDDLGWTDLACFGSPSYETPHVDALARDGVVFRQAYAPAAVCSPSRAAILTGRSPARLGITDWIHHDSSSARRERKLGRHVGGLESHPRRRLSTPVNETWLDADELTIAEMLRSRGYATAHVGKWHLGPRGHWPEDQGFDINRGGFRVGQPPSYFDPFANDSFAGIPTLPPRRSGEYLTDREADEAVRFIRENRDRPFFLYLAHYAVHAPLQAKGEIVQKYRAKPRSQHDNPVYGAMVASVDDALGTVMDTLDALGLVESTVVIFTSDNGGASHFGATDNRPLRRGKGFPYEGGLRVPLIISWKGRLAPRAREEPVIGTDLFPTVAALTGTPLPADRELDGRSLLGLLTGEGKWEERDIVWHFPHYWWGKHVRPFSVIRRGKWKLIRHDESDALELFDLDTDLGELDDLASREPRRVEALKRSLDERLDSWGARRVSLNPGYRGPNAHESVFSPGVTRTWIGPEYWANPMEDWRLHDGRMEVLNGGRGRNLHILTRSLAGFPGSLSASAIVGRVAGDADLPGAAGFEVGIRGPLPDYRSGVNRGRGMGAVWAADGSLRLAGERRRFPSLVGKQSVRLVLAARPSGESYLVRLEARDPESDALLAAMEREVAPSRLVGGMALSSNPALEGRKPGGRHWFRDWTIAGTKVEAHEDRRFGPVLWTQYTLSRGVLKVTAQFPPLGEEDSKEARLEIRRGGAWREAATARIDGLSRTATFRVEDWKDARPRRYRVVYEFSSNGGKPASHVWGGLIRPDPGRGHPLTLAAFTGNTDAAFPNSRLVRNVTMQDPDVLFFSGDQIYEFVGGFGIRRFPAEAAMLTYLRKWYLFGWAFRDLLKDRVSVIIPDDHDVYQGNVWGAGGKKLESWKPGIWGALGGYYEPAEFVDAVQRTQTSHLPDPFDPTPVEQGIGVYYCDLLYGGVSFAIIEDRKFKSGPAAVWPKKGRADHVKDTAFDPRDADVPGATLLGERQLRFLEHWAADWRGADFKVVLSQTILCNLANYHGPGQEFLVADLDSNGWPQTGRNRALDVIRRGCGFMVAGDQHLASVVRHGIEEWGDAGYSFCVPSIAAGYPRSWLPDREGRPVEGRPPGAPANTGRYRDGLGNRMTVFAVGNPEAHPRQGVMETLHDKASGHGFVRFDPASGTIRMECWRLLVDVNRPRRGDQFPGWPLTIRMEDNDGRAAAAYLPTLLVPEPGDPVIQVRDEESGEILYTLRIRGGRFRPKVFSKESRFTVTISDPERGRKTVLSSVRPGEGEIQVVF